MNNTLKKISIIFLLISSISFLSNVKAAENAYDNLDLGQIEENMGNNLDYTRGTEGWEQTIGWGNVDTSIGTNEGQNIASAIGNGGLVWDATGAWNYTTIESMDTTDVNNTITAKVSSEIASQIAEGNYSLQFNYYERNDKSVSEWVNAAGGIDEGLYSHYYGDGWESLSASEKNAFIAEVSANHPSMEASQQWGLIPPANGTIYTSKDCSIAPDGTVTFTLNDGLSSGVFAGLSIDVVDPVTNEVIGTIEFDELGQPTFNKGDAEEEAKEDDPPPPPPPPTNNHVWHSISTSITPFVDKTPNVTSRIFNADPSNSEKYTVQQSIPTSERLIYELSAKKAFHDIEVRKRVLSAGARDITIKVYASYSYESWEPTRYRRVRGEWVGYNYQWVTHSGSVSRTLPDKYSYSSSKTCYDVPKSVITPLSNGILWSIKEGFKLESGTIKLVGKTGPGPHVNSSAFARNPSVSPTESENVGHYHDRSHSVAKAAAQAAIDSSNGEGAKARIRAAVNAATGAGYTPPYSYGEDAVLTVTTGDCNYTDPVVSNSVGRVGALDAEASNFKNNFYSHKNNTFNMLNERLKYVKSNSNIADNELEEWIIPSNYPNGTYQSFGEVYYGSGAITISTDSFELPPNPVVIHTPVVNNSHVSSTSPFVNQKVTKIAEAPNNKYYLMLDEEFTITIPNNGQHKDDAVYPNYGIRNYLTKQGYYKNSATTWGKIKDVKFPFDVYVHYGSNDQKHFLKANTWLSESTPPSGLSVTVNSYTFTVPVWVKEQKYTIQTRVIAENAVDYSLTQVGANTDITKYVATKNIDVEVIGKIYDLRINASNDPGWTQVYSQKYKKEYITANEFPFGQQGHNRVTQYKYAPKLGYTFVFNFKTKGRKSNNIDLSIQPEGFYFIGKDGTGLQEVDLYYNSTTQKNIPILPGDTMGSVVVKLTDAFMEVPTQEFVDSNRIYPQPSEIGRVYNYNLGVSVGNFAKMNLPHSLRLCYNNFVEYVNALYGRGSTESSISNNAGTRDNVIGSVGHWHAGYRLPASTMAVPKGANIENAIRTNTLLKDGYIIVKFDIVTKSPKNNTEDPVAGEPGNNYLRYLGPEALNEAGEETGVLDPNLTWPKDPTTPIPTQPGKLPNGVPANIPKGSVAIFEGNLRSSNDAEVGGTH